MHVAQLLQLRFIGAAESRTEERERERLQCSSSSFCFACSRERSVLRCATKKNSAGTSVGPWDQRGGQTCSCLSRHGHVADDKSCCVCVRRCHAVRVEQLHRSRRPYAKRFEVTVQACPRTDAVPIDTGSQKGQCDNYRSLKPSPICFRVTFPLKCVSESCFVDCAPALQ